MSNGENDDTVFTTLGDAVKDLEIVAGHNEQRVLRNKLYEWLKKNPNLRCADCEAITTAETKPWISFNLGVVVCLKCSGVHRSLGVHISKIRSVDLDNWDEESVQSVLRTDNERVNKRLEYHCPPEFLKPSPDSGRETREKFINAKYNELFVSDGTNAHLVPIKDTSVVDDTVGASGIGMVEYTGIVSIRAIEGVNFPSMDTFSPSDPYVIIRNHQKKQHCKTKTIQNDNNPKWNQNLQVCVFGLKDPLQMEVYDEDLLTSDDLIGYGTVDLSQLADETPHKQTVTLFKRSSRSSSEFSEVAVYGANKLSPARVILELTYSAIIQ